MLHATKRPSPVTHPLEAARIRLEEALLRLEQASAKRATREANRAGSSKEMDVQRLERECKNLKEEKEKLNHLLKASEATRESMEHTAKHASIMLDDSITKLKAFL